VLASPNRFETAVFSSGGYGSHDLWICTNAIIDAKESVLNGRVLVLVSYFLDDCLSLKKERRNQNDCYADFDS
tara:strand:+ start:981 stop:1199 length:219 start_codon:yes stop_codon:yes gene_type:complete